MLDFAGLLLLLSFALVTVVAMVAIHEWLGPKRSGKIHDMSFECGNIPDRIVRGRFSVKFFVVALLFVLFDVELIFLFPWAVVYRELGVFGFFEMLVFLTVVVAGLFYSIQRGALEWD